ncbi:MAG: class I SAM-dependent methyltransferase family protein [Candidatus Lokiarchaeota archaeon]|nr:class I SAM-dependent methyltransferase family protein [Candidatus Lokiarchaeota archaeon]
MKFRDQLRNKLQSEIPENLLPLLPSGIQFISTIAVLNLKEELYDYKIQIGNAVMTLIPKTTAVWVRTGTISGQFRTPEGLEHICGSTETEVIHTENKIRYKFDFTNIMFAKGNVTERQHLPKLVRPGEIIIDMFAGIGYFSLGIAMYAKPEQIYSIELNPISYKYLEENIRLNKLTKKITPIHGDCAEETLKLGDHGIKADRIIMGVFPAPYSYLKDAISVVKPKKLVPKTDIETFIENTESSSHFDLYPSLKMISNTILHFEGVVIGRDFTEFYQNIQKEIRPLGFDSAIIATRFVKSFGPKMYHVVLDLAIGTQD